MLPGGDHQQYPRPTKWDIKRESLSLFIHSFLVDDIPLMKSPYPPCFICPFIPQHRPPVRGLAVLCTAATATHHQKLSWANVCLGYVVLFWYYIYAQRITSGLFELLLHAFCKHFYWIYYTLAINFRANMNTGIERSPKRIVLLCSQHYYQVRSGDPPPPPSSSVLGAQSAAIPIHSSGGRTIHANHHHHHSLSKSILILADDEQQGKHDLVLVAEAQF